MYLTRTLKSRDSISTMLILMQAISKTSQIRAFENVKVQIFWNLTNKLMYIILIYCRLSTSLEAITNKKNMNRYIDDP
jgi:hypothetical protein